MQQNIEFQVAAIDAQGAIIERGSRKTMVEVTGGVPTLAGFETLSEAIRKTAARAGKKAVAVKAVCAAIKNEWLYEPKGDTWTRSGGISGPQAPEKPTKKEKAAKKEKGTGVIAALIRLLDSGTSLGIGDLVDGIIKVCPDRDPDKVRSTVRTQLSRLPKETGIVIEKAKGEGGIVLYRIAPKKG